MACSAIALLAGSAVAQSSAPDLSKYDCGLIASASPALLSATHIGQIIKGRYVEWNEFTIVSGTPARPYIACISQLVPTARALTAAEAESFLKDSAAIGAPAAGSERAQSTADGEPPVYVQPEPPKHAIAPDPGTERALSNGDELPPVPVTKSSDPNAREDTARPVAPAPAQIQPNASIERSQAIGVDDRQRVPDTTIYPWSTVGYLIVTYPNGASYRCSGVLVSPYVVMTAGHCIHNNNRGGFVAQARFYPGQYQNTFGSVVRPYGSRADWANLRTTQRWMQISGNDSYPVTEYQNDFAAIQFTTPFTHTDTFMPIVFGNTASLVASGGYPARVNGADTVTAHVQSGNERSLGLRTSHIREFAVDSSGGNSGGPFWTHDPATTRPMLVGILSYGEELNDRSGGPWYDSWNQSLVRDWMAWTPNGVAAPLNSASGLRMASVFSSQQFDSESFVRLYNPGTSAGTVDITLADYSTGQLLGTWTSPSIAPGSSPQFAIRTLESNAVPAVTNAPMFYSLSVRPTFDGYFQHVLWRRADGSITDLTTCDVRSTTDPKLLMNVHSSVLQGGYPSTVIVHNTGASPVAVTLGIYDARNGARLGAYTTPVLQSNAQDIRSIASMEGLAGIAPASTMYHYIIRAETNFTGYLQHLVRNVSAGVVTDMSSFCQMARAQ